MTNLLPLLLTPAIMMVEALQPLLPIIIILIMVLLHHPPPLLSIIVLIVYQAIDSSDSDKTLMQPVCVGKLDQYQHLMDTSVTIYVFFSTSMEINQNDWLKRVASSST